MKRKKLPASFFLRPDVVRISKELLGCRLFTRVGDSHTASRGKRPKTGGIIVETEAYSGARDRASHAYGNRRTRRTEVMFWQGGVAYVYLCYGVHALFNIVTNLESVPDALLIRAIEPTHGIEMMLRRRNKKEINRSLTAGPGALAGALGIGLQHTGTSVLGDEIWIEAGEPVKTDRIEAGPRVGVQYAGADAKRPWRFRVRDSAWTSRAK
ncbi:DNA-3-methyladenine glycosylase [Verrucomicrobiota bacterium]